MANYLSPVTDEYIYKDGNLYKVTHRFIKKHGFLYPIMHKYIAKRDFNITVFSGSNKSFILPTSGRLNDINNSYAWLVDWGDGTTSEHSGTGSTSSGISHSYPLVNTNYTIVIKPLNPSESGWLRAFGFSSSNSGSNASSNKDKVIMVDGQLTEQMIRISDTNTHVCSYMFYECRNLTMGSSFQLPQSITSVGDFFCYHMFANCTNLTMNSVFQLPQGITETSFYFCHAMFLYCKNLTMNSVFQLPQGITGYLGSYACNSMFYGCSNLQINSVFQVPQGITYFNAGGFGSMFANCKSITRGVVNFFGNLVLEGNNLGGGYESTFANCINLNEPLDTIPQLQIVPNTDKNTFQGCPADIIAPLHTYWK